MELLQAIDAMMDKKLDRLENRINDMDENFGNRLDGIDGRLDGIDGRLDGIDGRLDGIDGRLDGIDSRLDGIDNRLDGLENRINDMDENFGRRLTRLEVLMENELPRQIRLLAEGHHSLVEHQPKDGELDELKNRVLTVENILSAHTNEIAQLKKAN